MSISTILLLMLFVGISMYSKYNKKIAEQSVLGDDSADDVQEDDAEFFSDEEPSFEEENPYFTYESETVETPVREAPKPKPQPQPVAVAAVEEPARPQFDLRQAVISQVILSNKYINEINQ